MTMRRPILLLIGTIAVVGFGLFRLTYEVQDLEEELARLNRTILEEQEAIHVLEAEWSYLNRPARLEKLNDRHLGLGPLSEASIGDFAGLPRRDAPVSDPANEDPALQEPDPLPVEPPVTGATLASARIVQ